MSLVLALCKPEGLTLGLLPLNPKPPRFVERWTAPSLPEEQRIPVNSVFSQLFRRPAKPQRSAEPNNVWGIKKIKIGFWGDILYDSYNKEPWGILYDSYDKDPPK